MAGNENDPTDLGIEGSNPNASGPQGLRGGMGISSERTGPYDSDDGRSVDEGLQGTRAVGEASTGTEGTMSTDRHHPEQPAEGRRDTGAAGADTPSSATTRVEGPEMDDRQQEATQGWADTQPAASEEAGEDDDEGELDVDRTVGESNTAEVPSHPFDRTKNPGHSHG